MRKVLSLVLVLALVLGSFAFTFAATPSDVVGEDSEDAVNVLMELGVVSGYPDGSYKPAGIVTRGEMAKIIICALGLEDYAAGSSSFSDMAGHWADKYVAYAVSLGIINGYPDNTFKADNTVSYDEAAKMLVASLGYTEDSLVGAWPVNWVTKAKVLGILDGIKAGSAGANRGDIAIMTYQTLDQEIGKVNKDGDFVTALTSVGTSDNMLTRLDASLFAPAVAYVTADNGIAGASFVVTGDEDSIISLKELQGALVTAYANDDDEIIAIKEVKSQFYTEEIDGVGAVAAVLAGGDEIGDYEIKAAALPAVGTTETYSFVNGVAAAATEVATATFVDGDEVTIACEFSGNYITKIYSISSWDITVGASDELQIDEDDLDDIADNELFTMDFPLNDDDEVDYAEFALYGVDSLDDIEEDDIVTAYDDGTGIIARVEVGQEVVTGTISKITSSGAKATVGGKVYEVGANAVAGTIAGLGASVGDEVELYLNYAGDIYDIEVIDGSDDMLAVVIDYDLNAAPTLTQGNSVIKLFLADGTTKTFEVDDDDLTNAAVCPLFSTGAGAGGTTAPGAGIITVGSVVEYSLDTDGNLNGIAFEAATGDDSSGNMDITSSGTYDGFYIASGATIFTTDDATAVIASTGLEIVGTDDDDWGVTTLDKILGTDDVNAYYSVDATSKKIEWMVIEGGSTDEDIFAVYNDYSEVDTDAGYEVHVLVDGVATEYEASSLTKADLATYGPAQTVPWAPVYAAGELYMYKVVLGTDGGVNSWTRVVTDGVDYTRTLRAGGVAAGNKVKNNVLTIAAGPEDFSLSTDIVIYTWLDADGEWVKGSTSAFSNTDYTDIVLYDIDADAIIDYALVQE
ncbi:MAG: S-layer homology domain-containing protein [Eubacteriales bacterium]|nr:S-layer homology domain-containing protein [Eubacteriales bacterium]